MRIQLPESQVSQDQMILKVKGPFVHGHSIPICESSEDTPSVAGSELSLDYDSDDNSVVSLKVASTSAPRRLPLQWVFKGLTLWLEYEEFDGDLTRAIDEAVRVYGTEKIPMPHSTIIYGMSHMTVDEAKKKLAEIPSVLPEGRWAFMEKPRGLTCDIAVEGRPGQVCSIAWSELSLSTNDKHEECVDAVYDLFGVQRPEGQKWTPHISLAYDNPEDTVLNLQDFFDYVSKHPSLMRGRRPNAASLWNTEGKMGEWQCLDRVYFNI